MSAEIIAVIVTAVVVIGSFMSFGRNSAKQGKEADKDYGEKEDEI